MKTVKQRIQKRRKFTEEFKLHIVREFESGKFSIKELSILYGLPLTNLYRWIYKYSTTEEYGYRVVELKNSSYMKIKDLQKEIKQLKEMLADKQIKIELLEKQIELAEKRHNIDIKKKKNTTPLSGLKNIRKKGGSK